MTKPELRKILAAKRLELSPEEHHEKDILIRERLVEVIDWSFIKTLHYFEPILRLGEPDVTDLIFDSGVELYTSRRLDEIWQTVTVDTGEPVDGILFDAVIVPMLGFDASLHRLGYGGGYYDRFLAAQPQARKIGICYEFGRLNELPHEPHDIPLDLIVTEKQILSFLKV